MSSSQSRRYILALGAASLAAPALPAAVRAAGGIPGNPMLAERISHFESKRRAADHIMDELANAEMSLYAYVSSVDRETDPRTYEAISEARGVRLLEDRAAEAVDRAAEAAGNLIHLPATSFGELRKKVEALRFFIPSNDFDAADVPDRLVRSILRDILALTEPG